MDVPANAKPYRTVRYASSDGLTLNARDYGDPTSPWLPLVCLPGLTRTARDFHELAVHFSTQRQRPRRVVSFDYRGRGESQWDGNTANYNPLTEMGDVLDGMAALGIPRAAIIGTSRGGIIAMLIGLTRPQTVAAVVMNDIGPAIEPRGLARLKTYVGRTPPPRDWPDAARIQRQLHSAQFTAFDDADWEIFAHLTYRDDEGHPVIDYDPALAGTLAGVEIDEPPPALWNEFRALAQIPVLVLRGQNSDLLSPATLAEMKASHPRLEAMTVADQGHAPLLRHGSVLNRLGAFILAVEGDAGPSAPRAATDPGANA